MFDKYFIVYFLFDFINNSPFVVSGGVLSSPQSTKKGADISLDYYFGSDDSALRLSKYIEDCDINRSEQSCPKHCGTNYACLLSKCFCMELIPQFKKAVLQEIQRRLKYRQENVKPLTYEKMSQGFENNVKDPNYMKMEELALRPSLRHHIAHFCPNLALARKCIATCMKQGKPAFCGKDHVCYCGHKYPKIISTQNSEETSTVKNSDIGIFDDLYKKYFGPGN